MMGKGEGWIISDKTYSVLRVRLSTEGDLYGSRFLRGEMGSWAEGKGTGQRAENWGGRGRVRTKAAVQGTRG